MPFAGRALDPIVAAAIMARTIAVERAAGRRGAGAPPSEASILKEGTMRSYPIRSLLAVCLGFGLTLAGGASTLDAQGKGTIKIATQSPLSGGQAALGEGIKLGAQLGIEKFKGNLEKAGFKVELVPYDDQAKPDVGVSNAKNIVADKAIMVALCHLNSGVSIPS